MGMDFLLQQQPLCSFLGIFTPEAMLVGGDRPEHCSLEGLAVQGHPIAYLPAWVSC